MPTLCYLFGLRICMFMELNSPHHLPHFHIFIGNTKLATVSVKDGTILAGNLSVSEKKLLKSFVLEHKKDLLIAWELLQKGENPPKINV